MAERPVALVTGASRGIGRAIALELARQGFDVAGTATPRGGAGNGRLAEVGRLAEASGAAFEAAAADLADLSTHGPLLDRVMERFGRIDAFVNNAGIGPAERKDLLQATPESFDRVLGLNLRGAFFLAREVAVRMIAQEERRGKAGPDEKAPPRSVIVFITSVSAALPSPDRAEYCISKAGASHAARIFAHRLAPEGIRVYEVRPGIIRTDLIAPALERYERKVRQGGIPLGRLGDPEDVARAVASLARGDFNYSTGLILEVDGGMQIQSL
jgi:3-oxoacyl-[acyl-carrier protein] reductase